jgi:hypothetical protein
MSDTNLRSVGVKKKISFFDTYYYLSHTCRTSVIECRTPTRVGHYDTPNHGGVRASYNTDYIFVIDFLFLFMKYIC